MPLPVLRSITAADVETIAQLHAESWARAYQGILDAHYLGEGLLTDRRHVWQATLEAPASRACGWLATVGVEPAGFVYGTLDKDAECGTHLENLHVHPAMHGRGIGRMLLTQMLQEAVAQATSATVFLWVYEANVPARRFYERMGGACVETRPRAAPDGSMPPSCRYLWTPLRTRPSASP